MFSDSRKIAPPARRRSRPVPLTNPGTERLEGRALLSAIPRAGAAEVMKFDHIVKARFEVEAHHEAGTAHHHHEISIDLSFAHHHHHQETK